MVRLETVTTTVRICTLIGQISKNTDQIKLVVIQTLYVDTTTYIVIVIKQEKATRHHKVVYLCSVK